MKDNQEPLRDPHTETAAKLFGVPESEVTPEQRAEGKRVNLALIYSKPKHPHLRRLP